ncbi:uncharacterized protein MYCFIDRAFT_170371 [Pseudocercospora fijiensis CIRAD86]|uniref:Uncharacterized protein n=1 Tax=Pseudocercospora fijiensis (strain CIRAD86) TaxID=383855 RepID=N1QAD8_PSEFD|nr:uncharacterized protein MYCFIDRAFT_170371 [Pseudocercospora fijiensis CIRAD86]EME88796.1 hypothetical protein MYCFIDRAFT_170371 [Pseudocercospora fijiensis CIRAD86]
MRGKRTLRSSSHINTSQLILKEDKENEHDTATMSRFLGRRAQYGIDNPFMNAWVTSLTLIGDVSSQSRAEDGYDASRALCLITFQCLSVIVDEDACVLDQALQMMIHECFDLELRFSRVEWHRRTEQVLERTLLVEGLAGRCNGRCGLHQGSSSHSSTLSLTRSFSSSDPLAMSLCTACMESSRLTAAAFYASRRQDLNGARERHSKALQEDIFTIFRARRHASDTCMPFCHYLQDKTYDLATRQEALREQCPQCLFYLPFRRRPASQLSTNHHPYRPKASKLHCANSQRANATMDALFPRDKKLQPFFPMPHPAIMSLFFARTIPPPNFDHTRSRCLRWLESCRARYYSATVMDPTTRSRSQSRDRSRGPAGGILQETPFTYDPKEARSRSRSRPAKRKLSALSKAWRLAAQILSLAVLIFAVLAYWSYQYVPPTQKADPTWVFKAPIGLPHYQEVANASSDALKEYHLGNDMKNIMKNLDEIVNSTEAFSKGALSKVLPVEYGYQFHVINTTFPSPSTKDKTYKSKPKPSKPKSTSLLKGILDLSKINNTRWANKNIQTRRENLTHSTSQNLHNMSQLLTKARHYSPTRDPLRIWKEYLTSRTTASKEISHSAETLLHLAMHFSITWDQYIATLASHRAWANTVCRKLETRHILIFWSRPAYCRISDGTWYNFEKIDEKILLSLVRLKAPYIRVQLAYKSLARHLGNVEETIGDVRRLEEFGELADPFTMVEVPEDIEGFLADQAEVAMGLIKRVVEEEKGFNREGWMRNYAGGPLMG